MVHVPGGNLAEDVPLLRGIHKADAAAGADALTPLDDLQSGELLVIEASVVKGVVHEHVRAPGLEIVEVVHFQALSIRAQGQRGGQGRHCDQRKFSHKDKLYVELIIVQCPWQTPFRCNLAKNEYK